MVTMNELQRKCSIAKPREKTPPIDIESLPKSSETDSELIRKYYFSSPEVAKMLDLTPGYIGLLCRQGILESEKIDRFWFIKPGEITKWKAKQKRKYGVS